MAGTVVYKKLVQWKNIEVPRPGRDAILGFCITFGACLLLHFALLWLCSVLAAG
jgi:hypothetical protein